MKEISKKMALYLFNRYKDEETVVKIPIIYKLYDYGIDVIISSEEQIKNHKDCCDIILVWKNWIRGNGTGACSIFWTGAGSVLQSVYRGDCTLAGPCWLGA